MRGMRSDYRFYFGEVAHDLLAHGQGLAEGIGGAGGESLEHHLVRALRSTTAPKRWKKAALVGNGALVDIRDTGAAPTMEPLRPTPGAPNVLIILIDDMGLGA